MSIIIIIIKNYMNWEIYLALVLRKEEMETLEACIK